jgi:16S rRNA (cytidine1402-2'-O)-methyltransferase
MSAGVLYIVATPIGNLDDITVRALEVLRTVNLVACEDTRKSRVLLSRWQIATETMSLHKFSEVRKAEQILRRLEQGQRVALICDAGTPALSDPGSRLVKAARDAGFTVVPVPGPSSITAALSVSGMDSSSFLYLGFAPRTDPKRKIFFQELLTEHRSSVFFETAKRILATLHVASEILPARKMVLLRELTKVYEEILAGDAATLAQTLELRDSIKGEIVIVVSGAADSRVPVDCEEIVHELMREGLSGKRLADEAHRRFGVRKGDAYSTYLKLKAEIRS